MRSGNIEVVEAVLVDHGTQVALAKNDHVVQAFMPNTAEKSFDDRIHQRCSDGVFTILLPAPLAYRLMCHAVRLYLAVPNGSVTVEALVDAEDDPALAESCSQVHSGFRKLGLRLSVGS